MRRVIQLTVTISFLTVSPLFGQEVSTLKWRAVHFRDGRLKLTGSAPLLDERSAVPRSFEDWPRLAQVGVWSIVGAGTFGGGTALLLGVIWVAGCQTCDDEFLSHKFTDTEVTFGAAIAIAAGVGFVTGGILGALNTRETGGGRRRPQPQRANATVVPLRDGRLGIGASVRF